MLTDTPKWKYTFAQTQPFAILGQCNDAKGLGCLNLSKAKGDLLISFDDGQNYARVGEVLYCYGVKDLTRLVQDRDAHTTWKTSFATFKDWMYWMAQGQKPDLTQFEVKREKLLDVTADVKWNRWYETDPFQVPADTEPPLRKLQERITKGQPSIWENQYQKLTEFDPFSSYARWQELLKNLPPLRLPDQILKEKDWTTPPFEFGPFVVDTDDTQGQAGTQTPEQMQARIQDLEKALQVTKEGRDQGYNMFNTTSKELQAERAKTENLQRTIDLLREGQTRAENNARRVGQNLEAAQVTIQNLEALAKRQQEDIRVITQDRDFQVKVVQRLERQHEHDVKLSKIQAQVLPWVPVGGE